MKPKKRVIKRKSDMRKITISIPGKLYYQIKDFAQEDIRTMSQQARLFLEIGLQVVSQQSQPCEDGAEPEEKPSCIGFQIERNDEDDE